MFWMTSPPIYKNETIDSEWFLWWFYDEYLQKIEEWSVKSSSLEDLIKYQVSEVKTCMMSYYNQRTLKNLYIFYDASQKLDHLNTTYKISIPCDEKGKTLFFYGEAKWFMDHFQNKWIYRQHLRHENWLYNLFSDKKLFGTIEIMIKKQNQYELYCEFVNSIVKNYKNDPIKFMRLYNNSEDKYFCYENIKPYIDKYFKDKIEKSLALCTSEIKQRLLEKAHELQELYPKAKKKYINPKKYIWEYIKKYLLSIDDDQIIDPMKKMMDMVSWYVNIIDETFNFEESDMYYKTDFYHFCSKKLEDMYIDSLEKRIALADIEKKKKLEKAHSIKKISPVSKTLEKVHFPDRYLEVIWNLSLSVSDAMKSDFERYMKRIWKNKKPFLAYDIENRFWISFPIDSEWENKNLKKLWLLWLSITLEKEICENEDCKKEAIAWSNNWWDWNTPEDSFFDAWEYMDWNSINEKMLITYFQWNWLKVHKEKRLVDWIRDLEQYQWIQNTIWIEKMLLWARRDYRWVPHWERRKKVRILKLWSMRLVRRYSTIVWIRKHNEYNDLFYKNWDKFIDSLNITS